MFIAAKPAHREATQQEFRLRVVLIFARLQAEWIGMITHPLQQPDGLAGIEGRVVPGERQTTVGEVEARIGQAFDRLQRAFDPADTAAAVNAIDNDVHGCDAVGGAAGVMRIIEPPFGGHFSTTRLLVR